VSGDNKAPKWSQYVAIAILAVSSLFVIWASQPVWEQQHLNDDSFITLTYAKNLVNGNGFVYNHPPATLGTTTPFFTLLTAGLTRILPTLTVIENAILISVLSWLGTAISLFFISKHLKFHPIAAAMPAVVLLTIVNSTWLWFLGMEIWLFEFLLVLSVYLVITNRQIWAGLIVGLLFLTRGEGSLMGIMLGIFLLWKNKKIPWRYISAGSFVLILWTTYAYPTFGTLLPNTLTAKIAHQTWLVEHGRNYHFFTLFSQRLPQWIQSFKLGSTWLMNPFLILAGVGLMFVVIKKQWSWLLFVGWGLIYLIAYSIINPGTYPWYALHFYIIIEIMAGVGLAWLVNTAIHQTGRRKMGLILTAVLVAVVFIGSNLSRGFNTRQTYSGDNRAGPYTAIATWLNQNTQPEDSVAYLEIGYLGYFSNNRIVDLAGLIDPKIAANISQHGFTWGFFHYHPTYLVFNPGMDSEAYLAKIRAAQNQYTEVARFPGGPNDLPLILFQRIESQN